MGFLSGLLPSPPSLPGLSSLPMPPGLSGALGRALPPQMTSAYTAALSTMNAAMARAGLPPIPAAPAVGRVVPPTVTAFKHAASSAVVAQPVETMPARLTVAQPVETMPAQNPVLTTMPVAPGVGADKAEAIKATKRRELVNRWKDAPAFSGILSVAGQYVQVKGGTFVLDGVTYGVSKDGRAVIAADSMLLVGEVVGGVVQKPSTAFVDEMQILGGVV